LVKYYTLDVKKIVLLRGYRIINGVGVLILDNIGEKIKCERLKKSLKQYKLAEKAGISNTYLSDIEVARTKPSLKVLEKIAKALEIDIKEFF